MSVEYEVNEKIAVRYPNEVSNGEEWYTGKITHVKKTKTTPTYTVCFDADGRTADNIHKDKICPQRIFVQGIEDSYNADNEMQKLFKKTIAELTAEVKENKDTVQKYVSDLHEAFKRKSVEHQVLMNKVYETLQTNMRAIAVEHKEEKLKLKEKLLQEKRASSEVFDVQQSPNKRSRIFSDELTDDGR